MEQLFTTMHHWISGSFFIAIAGSFIWGILSVILSPCHLATIPLIVGYISSQDSQTPKKAFITSLIFSAGIFTSLILIGAITLSLGRIAGDIGPWVNYLIGGLLVLLGLNLTGLIAIGNWDNISFLSKRKKSGNLGIFLFGFLIGVGLGPCTFAFMAPVIILVFEVSSSNLIQAVMIMLFFTIGHSGVVILAGTFTGVVQKYLHWTKSSKSTKVIKIVCGILIVVGGISMIFKA